MNLGKPVGLSEGHGLGFGDFLRGMVGVKCKNVWNFFFFGGGADIDGNCVLFVNRYQIQNFITFGNNDSINFVIYFQ